MSSIPAVFALVVGMQCTTGACADDADAPLFLFSGFATLSATHSSETRADFTSTIFKPNGAGYSHTWSADVDSLIGAQVTANLTPQLSMVLQVVSEQNYDDTYRPHAEWANIKYQFNPDFSIRIGRTALPAFMLSDSRKIAYTLAWVRPPIEVYSLVPITSNDGVDASYRTHVGTLTNTLQVTAGRTDLKLPDSGFGTVGTVKGRDIAALFDTLEQGALTLRLSYGHARLTVPEFGVLFDAFRQFGPQGVAIAEKYDVNDRPFTFLGVGASYNPGDWFAMSEWGTIDTHSFFGKRTAWYAGTGYRIGSFTPYATYARAKADNLSDPGLDVTSLPPFLVGTASSLNAALNSLLRTKPVQTTISIGGRWDFMKQAALKLQFDRTRISAGSSGTLSNVQPGFQPGGKFNVFSATVDLVF